MMSLLARTTNFGNSVILKTDCHDHTQLIVLLAQGHQAMAYVETW